MSSVCQSFRGDHFQSPGSSEVVRGDPSSPENEQKDLRIRTVPVTRLLFSSSCRDLLAVVWSFAYGVTVVRFSDQSLQVLVVSLAHVLFATATTLLANLAADMAYAWLDPRISFR